MSYSQNQATAILRQLGFRVRTTSEFNQVVRTFQNGYNLGAWLTVDGMCGPATSAALSRSLASGKKCSANFTWAEFTCTCGGRYTACRRILVSRYLLRSLQTYRAKVGGPISVASGYRCPNRNKDVGGASSSQHMYGSAADVSYSLSDTVVKGMHVFSGIGRSASTHKVRHMDRRDISGNNPTNGTLINPTCWDYAS